MLGLTEKQLLEIESTYAELPQKLREFRPIPKDCTAEELICLKFLWSSMPASDWASYSTDFFLKSVRDALSARKALAWGEKLSAELFLNYVLPPRVNNEDLSDCREPFFNELYPRVKGLSMTEAVLAVNYWCLEKAVYRSTDIRTNSPLSVVRSTYGRCGEESTLCVAALRSVGIPARQCYTPRWAHCDDNHAWVEVWTGTEWHYLGACEPEPALDRGWFQGPASRGMLIHAKVLSRMVSEPDIAVRTPVMSQVNILNSYAKVKRLRVHVQDENRKPVCGAMVRFELVNFAQMYALAEILTNEDGDAFLTTGFGCLWIHVSYNGKFLHAMADANCKELVFSTSDMLEKEENTIFLTMVPPTAAVVPEPELSAKEIEENEKQLDRANTARKAFGNTFLQGDKAESFAGEFFEYKKEIAELIALSNGNHREISDFLKTKGDIPLSYRVELLKVLSIKDMADATCSVLNSHLNAAYSMRSDYPSSIFIPYILCPRVGYEPLTDYRAYIKSCFTDEQKSGFKANPMLLWQWIQREIEDCGEREYSTLTSAPVGLLQLKYGNGASRNILFVAVCRTIGVPARLNELEGTPEYLENNVWKSVVLQNGETPSCGLTLKAKEQDTEALVYEKNVTIARLENGIYRTLGQDGGMQSGNSDNCLSFALTPGSYRVTAVNRLVDGTVLTELIPIALKSGDKLTLELTLPKAEDGGASGVDLPVQLVKTSCGDKAEASALLPIGCNTVMAFLLEGAEPTEHLLNEILEDEEGFSALRDRVLLLVRNEESLKNPLLARALKQTGIQYAVCADDSGLQDTLKAIKAQSSILPLVMGLDENKKCIFHLSGYNVGTGELLLQHLRKGMIAK